MLAMLPLPVLTAYTGYVSPALAMCMVLGTYRSPSAFMLSMHTYGTPSAVFTVRSQSASARVVVCASAGTHSIIANSAMIHFVKTPLPGGMKTCSAAARSDERVACIAPRRKGEIGLRFFINKFCLAFTFQTFCMRLMQKPCGYMAKILINSEMSNIYAVFQ